MTPAIDPKKTNSKKRKIKVNYYNTEVDDPKG